MTDLDVSPCLAESAVEPSNEELLIVYSRAVAKAVESHKDGRWSPEDNDAARAAGLRAVLARFGAAQLRPVPVAGEEYHDDMGTVHIPLSLEERICQLLREPNPPSTVAQILAEVRKDEFVFKHEIACTIWRLARNGLVAVEAGRIRNLLPAHALPLPEATK